MAMTGVTKNLRDGVVTLMDGTTPTPNSLQLVLDEGDLSMTEEQQLIEVYRRGKASHRRLGDETLIKVSFSAKYTNGYENTALTGTPTMVDALRKRNLASAWVSVEDAAAGALTVAGPTGSEVYSTNVKFEINDATGSAKETFTLKGFHADTVTLEEGDEYNTISVEGTCLQVFPSVTNP